MEIYNEDINDLFAVENQKLQIHESLEVSDVMRLLLVVLLRSLYNNNDIYWISAWCFCCGP